MSKKLSVNQTFIKTNLPLRLNRIAACAALFLVGFEFGDVQAAAAVFDQNFDPAFGGGQPFLAEPRKFYSLLKKFEAFFERKIAVLKLFYDAFEFVQRFFESLFHIWGALKILAVFVQYII